MLNPLGATVVAVFLGLAALSSAAGADAPVYAWTADNVDVDALAARMKTYQTVYASIRDEALATYAKAHPNPNPYDNDAHKLIQLTTYLWAWGDPYGEGLWDIAYHEADRVKNAGLTDPIVGLWSDIEADGSRGNYNGVEMHHRADAFAASAYPEVFKLWYYDAAFMKVGRALDHPDPASIPEIARHWGDHYSVLLQKPLPNQLLYSVGSCLLNDVDGDGDLAAKAHDEIKQVFAAVAPESPVLPELEGRYLLNEAWQARSSDTADKVSQTQWQQFGDLLAQADTVLEAAYAAHPEESEISTLMLTVELGQGRGRDRMEQWYSRAIQTDPQNGDAYAAKFWYLQPRWYGSAEDLIGFGQECIDAPQPVPVALSSFFVAMSEESDLDQAIYFKAEAWTPLEKAYRLYLTQFPQSIRYRTGFAKHAAQGHHFAVAKEQFALLGNNWDRSMMTEQEYTLYQMEINRADHAARETAGSNPSSSTSSDGGGGVLISALWGAWRAITWFF